MTRSVAFDTLAYAKKLESGGIALKQAEAHAEALAVVLEVNFLSKKEEESGYEKLCNKIDQLKEKLLQEITQVRNDLHQEITQLKNELHQEISQLKNELHQEISHVKIDMIKWVVGVAFAQTALILSVLKFFH